MKKTSILIVILVILFLGASALAVWFWKSYQKQKEVVRLPIPLGLPASKSAMTLKAEGGGGPTALIAPYYPGLISYTYKLETTFPRLPSELQVYKVVKQTYTKDQALKLAGKFGFKDISQEDEYGYYFREGQTPSQEIPIKPGSEEVPVLEAEPEYTGRELTVTKDGCINYIDYSKEPLTEELKPQPPAGVESKEKAKGFAINYVKDKGILPEKFEVEVPEPWGRYSVIIYSKFNDYKNTNHPITVEVVKDGAIFSVSSCKIKLEKFNMYPVKTEAEALKVEKIEYRITDIELGYRSSYKYLEEDKYEEYLQPVLIFKGKDNLGNDFSFEIPAIKSEYLETIQEEPTPLRR